MSFGALEMPASMTGDLSGAFFSHGGSVARIIEDGLQKDSTLDDSTLQDHHVESVVSLLKQIRCSTGCEFFLMMRQADDRKIKTSSAGDFTKIDTRESVGAILSAATVSNLKLVCMDGAQMQNRVMPVATAGNGGCLVPMPRSASSSASSLSSRTQHAAPSSASTFVGASTSELGKAVTVPRRTPKADNGSKAAAGSKKGGQVKKAAKGSRPPALGASQAALADGSSIGKKRKFDCIAPNVEAKKQARTNGRIEYDPGLFEALQQGKGIGTPPKDKKHLKHSIITHLYAIFGGRVDYRHRPHPKSWPEGVEFKRPSLLKLAELQRLWAALPAVCNEEAQRRAKLGESNPPGSTPAAAASSVKSEERKDVDTLPESLQETSGSELMGSGSVPDTLGSSDEGNQGGEGVDTLMAGGSGFLGGAELIGDF